MSAPPLAGSVALVTGASRGIGLAVADGLRGAGARVARLARSLADGKRDRDTTLRCDVTNPEDVARAVRTVKAELGVPDIVVSNAGLFIIKSLGETSPADFVQSIATNLTGPFLIARALVPDMVKRGSGHLVTIGSSSDHIAYPWNTAYGASKHGVRGLHQVIAVEVARTGVRTTLVSPGRVDTEIWDRVDPQLRPDAAGRSVMMHAADVADAVLWAVTRPPRVDVTEIQMMPTIDKARG